MNEIEKPKQRGQLRQLLGKEYFILKRRYHWVFTDRKYANTTSNTSFTHSVFKHRSLVLRPLKDVDMYLQENKRTNLSIAIKHLHEIEIKPNEYFSLWKLVGRPTKRKGYLEGLVLKSGAIDRDIGGGLCQLGNLLFWVFAHSPLTITERYRHGFDVFPDVNRKVPFGAGATLSYNYIDLQVKNETEHSFIIKLWLDKTHLNGELFSNNEIKESYKIEERNHQIKQQYWGGYSRHNQIFKIINTGEAETESMIVENHAIMMYNPFLQNKKE
ncbi:VanW family protein [Cellulophaga sp. E16_2]|uniref:VanW family protein n=1 Tax=Cellulophaga algicola (strain DSM 14237 / IC166 / ACAM 630) TaxID=688270 RepID=E6XCW9_CELAD|nr:MULTISPECIES: VanW family protein [Cellulophaga]ADV50110.1 VanW family protein [Cellulophaga algicola DSM 14237]MBO0592498.1 VanW family protein [Cellulophaga sp. E16_2]